MLKTKKILVTGSSGTIGTGLCEELIEKDYDVVGLDIKENPWLEKINDLTIVGDLRDPKTLEKLPEDINFVIHLAANARVYNLVINPGLARDNFLMTYNMLDYCRKNKINSFCFASSRETYGNIKKDLIKESDADFNNCESPYTATKIGAEALIRAYQRCYGINFVIFRFSNVYGKYDQSDRLVPLFIKLTKEKKDLNIFGKEKFLDFTYIDDSVAGVIKCMENFDKSKNDVYNLADGRSRSIVDIAKLIQKEIGNSTKLIIDKPRIGEIIRFTADISKAKSKFNYSPQIDIELGIKKSVEWYNKYL